MGLWQSEYDSGASTNPQEIFADQERRDTQACCLVLPDDGIGTLLHLGTWEKQAEKNKQTNNVAHRIHKFKNGI